MKKMKIVLLFVTAALLSACYNDFDNPSPAKIYTDADIQAMGATRRTIADVKKMFTDKFGGLSGTGGNSSWGDTKYLQFDENIYIKGKVISDDEEGNIYKSLFLLDETGAIEVRLANGNFLTHHMGQYTYILLKDLYIGNYRMMLSIGNGPTDSYNVVGEHKFYANSNIELPSQLAAHVFAGEQSTLEVGKDIKVVNQTNYKQLGESDFGRLIRFENVKCHYAGVVNQDGTTNPALKNGNFEQIYPSWICTDVRPIVTKAWYKWAFSVKGTCLYGSVCFTYNDAAQYTSDKGVYTVRTSGFSRFAGRPVTKDGAVGTITGIYGIYSKQSDYSGGARDFATYQVSISNFSDLEFAKDAFLTEDQVKSMTPADSFNVPGTGEDNEELE
ncbi:MAG: DUF5689 domain-containing protein [Alistipes sp.]